MVQKSPDWQSVLRLQVERGGAGQLNTLHTPSTVNSYDKYPRGWHTIPSDGPGTAPGGNGSNGHNYFFPQRTIPFSFDPPLSSADWSKSHVKSATLLLPDRHFLLLWNFSAVPSDNGWIQMSFLCMCAGDKHCSSKDAAEKNMCFYWRSALPLPVSSSYGRRGKTNSDTHAARKIDWNVNCESKNDICDLKRIAA